MKYTKPQTKNWNVALLSIRCVLYRSTITCSVHEAVETTEDVNAINKRIFYIFCTHFQKRKAK